MEKWLPKIPNTIKEEDKENLTRAIQEGIDSELSKIDENLKIINESVKEIDKMKIIIMIMHNVGTYITIDLMEVKLINQLEFQIDEWICRKLKVKALLFLSAGAVIHSFSDE